MPPSTAAKAPAPARIATVMRRAYFRATTGFSSWIRVSGSVLAMIRSLPAWLAVLNALLSAQQPEASAPAAETRDVHSYARPAEAKTINLSLAWTIDFTRHEIAGAARWGLERKPDAKEIVFDTRDLVIEGVDALGAAAGPLPFKLGPRDPILGAPLYVTLPAGVSEILVRYRTSPSATGLQWL